MQIYYVGRVQPHTAELMAESKAKLFAMAEKDKARMMLEESKNKVESYIYKIKNKLVDDEENFEKFAIKKHREEVRKLAEDAEEWLYEDGYNADLATMEDKYAELSVPFEKILLRISEATDRPAAIEALGKKLTEIEALMEKWVEAKPQVTDEERKEVLDKVKIAREWIAGKEKVQSKKKPHEDPAFLSKEVPLQLKPIETLLVRLNRKPKPKPPKKDKNETTTNSTVETNTTVSSADEQTEGEVTPPTESKAATDDASGETPEGTESSGETKTDEPAKSEDETASTDKPVKDETASTDKPVKDETASTDEL